MRAGGSEVLSQYFPLRQGRRLNAAILADFLPVAKPENPSLRKGKFDELRKMGAPELDESKGPIPTAKFTCLDSIDDVIVKERITMTSEYVSYRPPNTEELDKMVEYEEDAVDNLWLKKLNNNRKKRDVVTSDAFCRVMDRLEKESIFQPKSTSGYLREARDEDVCCVCGDGDDEDSNKIIYCDLCNISVHQDCYGVPHIPEGSWLCRRCKLSPSANVTCALCPNSDGAFKPTSDGRWAHVICGIWLNEVHFLNAVFLEPVEGVARCLEVRSKLRCMICKKKTGACIQCSQRSCVRSFHVTCAQAAQMYMRVQAADDSDASEQVDVQRFAYCHVHDPDDPELDLVVRKKKMEVACRNAYKNLKRKKNVLPPVNVPVISREKVENIATRLSAKSFIRQVNDYWYLKRRQRCGVPLIKRLQADLESRNAPPSLNPLGNPELESMVFMYSTRRNELEKLRMMSELMKKREIAKKDHVEFTKQMFELLYTPLNVLVTEAINELEKKDKAKIFAEPVEFSVPGYREIIVRPMDLLTMKSKGDAGRYQSLADVRRDFELMCRNCDEFNKAPSNAYFKDYGRRFHQKGDRILKRYEERFAQSESLLKNDSDGLGFSLCNLNLYESVSELERVKENEPIESDLARSPQEDATSRNIFLQTPQSTPLLSLGRNKRQADNLLLSVAKRRKSVKEEETPSLRQSSITRFFAVSPSTPQQSEGRRTRFSNFRENSVQSPLVADVASSTESSTEDDDRLPAEAQTQIHHSLRSGRVRTRVEAAKMDNNDFEHDDIVQVNLPGSHTTIFGRFMDPCAVAFDDSLPPALAKDLRSHHRHNERHLCVLLFCEGRDNWDWYPAENVRHFDSAASPASRSKQYRLACEFRHRMQTTSVPAK